MNEPTPQVVKILDTLADLCLETLTSEERGPEDEAFETQIQPLVQALKTNGYGRTQEMPLQAKLENLVMEKSQTAGMHRRVELTAIAGKVQRMFDDVVRWDSKRPVDSSGTQPANISSATDH